LIKKACLHAESFNALTDKLKKENENKLRKKERLKEGNKR
jgi:hypothetical protein